MLKINLTPIALNLQSIIAEQQHEKMDKFNDNFRKLQSEVAVTKRLNTELAKRIATLQY